MFVPAGVPQEAVPVVGQPEEMSDIIPWFTFMLGEVKLVRTDAAEEPARASNPATASMAQEGGISVNRLPSSQGPFENVVENGIFLEIR